jgi:predicted AAA+ superfamily ATPase
MVKRRFWLHKVFESWKHKNIIWLKGVRRAGKTYLTQSINDIEYFDCELPRIRRLLDDPESFLNSLTCKKIVLDEIHRLKNPSEILKIIADHYKNIKVIATGSSSLGASKKFKDTLTNRKIEILLTPMISEDLADFTKNRLATIVTSRSAKEKPGAKRKAPDLEPFAFRNTSNVDLKHRFLHGGLPPFFLSKNFPENDIQEWIDSFWAKDIQELFRLERKSSFERFFELVMMRSGGIFQATNYSSECEVSHTTIANYLKVMEATYTAYVLKPFHKRKSTEIVSAPKVYAFDTAFTYYFNGWSELRDQDIGNCWEQFVLNELIAKLQGNNMRINYWRDKQEHEIDFVINKRGGQLMAIECKWQDKNHNLKNIEIFNRHYPQSKLFIVCSDITKTRKIVRDKFEIEVVNLSELVSKL